MTELVQFTLFGLMLGCVYAILAMGLVLTYTVTGVFNFAHGAVGMLAAFTYYELRVAHHWATPVAVATVVILIAPAMGLVAERLLRPFRGSPFSTSLVVTVALTVGLLGLSQKVFDPRAARHVPYVFGSGKIWIASVPVSYDRIGQVVSAVAIAFGLRVLLFRTPLGARMRCVVDDPDLARLHGVKTNDVARISWVVGFILAAAGGVLFAGGSNLNAVTLTFLVVNAYAAAMIGRLRSLPLTFAGALLLGVVQELPNVSWLWPSGEVFGRLTLAIPGIFLVVVVALVPSIRLSAGRIAGAQEPPIPTLTRSLAAAIALVVTVWSAVHVFPESYNSYVVRAMVIAVIALSLVALTGLSGQLSLIQYVFVGLGAFVSGSVFGNGTVLGMLAGGVVSGAFGLLVALPAARLQGLYLALSTFGVALICRDMLIGDPRVFGLQGKVINRPRVLGISTHSDAAFAVWCCVVFCLIALGLVWLRRSSFGRQLNAIRDSELASSALGIRVRLAKVLTFGLSAFIAGCAGSLFGGLQGSVDSAQFDPVNNLVIVLFAFVGGVTSISGAFLAGTIFALLSYAQASFPNLAGLVFVAIAAAAIGLGRQPNGLAGLGIAVARTIRRDRLDRGSIGAQVTAASAPIAGSQSTEPHQPALSSGRAL